MNVKLEDKAVLFVEAGKRQIISYEENRETELRRKQTVLNN